VIAAVVLLVTGRYLEQIYDFALGMNRWVLRWPTMPGCLDELQAGPALAARIRACVWETRRQP